MNWTKELPTEPGWYWCKQNGTTKMGELLSLGNILYFGRSVSSAHVISTFTGCEWCGPILPPK